MEKLSLSGAWRQKSGSAGETYLKRWRGKVQRCVDAPIAPLLAYVRPAMYNPTPTKAITQPMAKRAEITFHESVRNPAP
jgi:hypothetical protein